MPSNKSAMNRSLIIIGRERAASKPLLDLLLPYLERHSPTTNNFKWEVATIPFIQSQPVTAQFSHPRIGQYIYLFTSPRAVSYFFTRWKIPEKSLVVSIGRATTDALTKAGITTDMTSSIETSEGMLPQLLEWIRANQFKEKEIKIIQPTSDIAGTYLKEGLERAGIYCHQVAIYRVTPHPDLRNQINSLPYPPKIAIFYSASGVRAWCDVTTYRPLAVSIGTITTSALKEAGFSSIINSLSPAPIDLFTAIKESINI